MSLATAVESHKEAASHHADPRHTPWWAIDELCERQVRGQHAALRQAGAALRDQLSALARAHGGRWPQLVEVSVTFDTINATLVSHLAKEENILFPAFAALAAAWRDGTSAPPLPFPTVRHPIALMEAEHERLEHALARLHTLAETLSLPAEVADEWRRCESALEQFERELEADTRLEDGVLFPRALDLERALL